MSDVLLTLVVPHDVAQEVEDILLTRPDLVRGFTASHAEGHGSLVPLVEPAEQVSGHSPRVQIRTAGPEDAMRAVLVQIKHDLPRANVFYWLTPVIDMGRL